MQIMLTGTQSMSFDVILFLGVPRWRDNEKGYIVFINFNRWRLKALVLVIKNSKLYL